MNVSFDSFKKLDIRIGKIMSAEKVENSDKLLKLYVDFGTEKRQILSGIAHFYSTENLIGKEFPFIVNLEPRVIRGLESQGMILAVDVEDQPILMSPDKEVPPGSIVK